MFSLILVLTAVELLSSSFYINFKGLTTASLYLMQNFFLRQDVKYLFDL